MALGGSCTRNWGWTQENGVGGQAQLGGAKGPNQRPCQFSICNHVAAGGLGGGGYYTGRQPQGRLLGLCTARTGVTTLPICPSSPPPPHAPHAGLLLSPGLCVKGSAQCRQLRPYSRRLAPPQMQTGVFPETLNQVFLFKCRECWSWKQPPGSLTSVVLKLLVFFFKAGELS